MSSHSKHVGEIVGSVGEGELLVGDDAGALFDLDRCFDSFVPFFDFDFLLFLRFFDPLDDLLPLLLLLFDPMDFWLAFEWLALDDPLLLLLDDPLLLSLRRRRVESSSFTPVIAVQAM